MVRKTKLFASWKYFDISGWDEAGWEPEIKSLINLVEKEGIKTIYAYHNCWWTVMWTLTESSNQKVKRYSKKSGYNIFTQNDWEGLKLEQKTGHWTVWWIENNIDFIEIELKTRWWSESWKNIHALIDSLKIIFNK